MRYVVETLEDVEIPYMIGGSQAAVYYGEPRFTRDVDVVAGLGPAQIPALLARFPAPDFSVSDEAAREAVETRGQFNIIHPASGLKIDVFVSDLATTGMAGLLGWRPEMAAAEPPPETTRLRISRVPSTCRSPEWMAEELLRAEGFSHVQYTPTAGTVGVEQALASGEADISGHFAAPVILRVEAGDPIVILAGEHVGCFELLGTDRIRTIRDLKGRTVAVPALDPSPYAFLASMTAYVGLDPNKDINWVKHPASESMRLLAEGKIDAYLGFPPEPQALRAKGIGRVVVNSAVDRPWSQYFCCMLVGNREFVRKHPVATKRALRAILKAADLCAAQPERGRAVHRRGGRGEEL